MGHFREICAFAAEERLHSSIPVRPSIAEIINKSRRLRFSGARFGFWAAR